MEEAIQSTIRDAEKLEHQITSILQSLEDKGQITEAGDLTSVTGSGTKGGKSRNKKIRTGNKQKEGRNLGLGVVQVQPYDVVDSSEFVVTIREEIVFGLILQNVSNAPQNLPEIVLSFKKGNPDLVGPPCEVLHYRPQRIRLETDNVDVDNDTDDPLGDSILYHNPFVSENQEGKCKVQPKGQVLMTATFESPVHLLGQNMKGLILVASVLLNGQEICSRRFPLSMEKLINNNIQDENFRIHRTKILMAMAQHKESFRLNRLLSQGDKSPHKAVEKFLVSLGFEKAETKLLALDLEMDTFILFKNWVSPLWGTTFRIEKCSRNISTVRCGVTARSIQQFHVFITLFQNWVRREGRQERMKGLMGLRILPLHDDIPMTKAVIEEVSSIQELKQQQKLGKNFEISKWLREFIADTKQTDNVIFGYE